MTTRDQLLNQALALFVEKGYDNVGVQAIVDAVGVQKPTLYYYFKSKVGLLRALLERDYAPLLARLSDACDYQGDLPGALETIARVYLAFASQSLPVYRFALSSLFGPPSSELTVTFLPYFNRQYQLLSGVFEEAGQQHGNMKGRHYWHAISFLGSINALISTHCLDSQVELSEEAAFRTCKHFMYGIFS